MGQYSLSHEAKMDLARIYWRGRKEYREEQAERYYHAFFQRFEEIAEAPYKYQSVDHIKEGYRRSVCGFTPSTPSPWGEVEKEITIIAKDC